MTRAQEQKQNDLKQALDQQKGGTPEKRNDLAGDLRAYFERMKPEVKKALPKHLTADRLLRVALTAIRTTPQLIEATKPSLAAAIMQAAQLGLEPGTLGHVWFVPFKNRKRGVTEVVFIVGYRGMVQLCYNSGQVSTVAAHEVRENDVFEYEYGTSERLKHVPALSDRGEISHFYAYARLKDGAYLFHVMPKSEVDRIKNMSKASGSGPWSDHYVEMGRKTVLRNLCKYLPLSVEAAKGIEQDETVKHDLGDFDPGNGGEEFIEGEFSVSEDE